MKRYFVFSGGANPLSGGGAHNFYSMHSDLSQATTSLRLAGRSAKWSHLVDWETMLIYTWDKSTRKLKELP